MRLAIRRMVLVLGAMAWSGTVSAEEVSITIETIRCQKTESISGPDKVFYVISPKSGKGVISKRHELNDNEAWKVNSKALTVERGVPVAVTVWDEDKFYDKNKDQIAAVVGSAIGAIASAYAAGADAGAAVKAGQALAVAIVKSLGDPDDLVLSAVIDTKRDGYFVLHQRRGAKISGSQSFYVVTLKVGEPKEQVYELILKSIKCSRQEDNLGDDHAYIKVAGTRVWSKQMDEDDTRSLRNLSRRVTNKDIIELWERDDIDDDDHLGTNAIIDGLPATGGNVTYDFREDGARYRINAEIRVVPAGS